MRDTDHRAMAEYENRLEMAGTRIRELEAHQSDKLTIESALKELREMFPKSRCQVKITSFESGGFGVTEFDYEPKLYPHTRKHEAEIWLMDARPPNSELGIKMRGPTLQEAIAQVRAWHKEQLQ